MGPLFRLTLHILEFQSPPNGPLWSTGAINEVELKTGSHSNRAEGRP
jgi:hypothetical protein